MSGEEEISKEDFNKMNLDLARTPHTALTTVENTTALETNFSSNFYDLNTSDIALEVGADVFHAHQLVLWAWSTKFRQHLQDLSPRSLSTDNGQQILKLELHAGEDIAETFNDFLSFLYSGKVALNKDKIWTMYDLANTYCIVELQEVISQYLVKDFLASSLSREELINFMTEAKMRGTFDVFNYFRKKLLFNYWVEELPPEFTVKVHNFPAYFLKIFDDKSTSDVVIQTENKEFHLHRLLLCLQSGLLKELLPDHTAGKAYKLDKDLYCQNEATLEDILKFIYAETIDLDFRTAMLSLKIAKKLQINTLVDVCTTFLEEYAIHVSFNDELIHCLQQTALLKMNYLHDIFYQILLANFFLFVDRLLPTMSNDLLCQILESSSLVACNEYSLLCSLLPRLVKLKDSDPNSYHKMLNLIRFHQMSVSEIPELDLCLELSDDLVMAALLYRCSLWEQTFTKLTPNHGPRLYLDPPRPCITTETFQDQPQLSIEGQYDMGFVYKLRTTQQDMSANSYLLKQENDGDPFTIYKHYMKIDASWCHDKDKTLRFTLKFQEEKYSDDDANVYDSNDSNSIQEKYILLQTTGVVVLYREERAIVASTKTCPLKLAIGNYGDHKLFADQEMYFEFGLPRETIVDDNKTTVKLHMFTKPRQQPSTVCSVVHD